MKDKKMDIIKVNGSKKESEEHDQGSNGKPEMEVVARSSEEISTNYEAGSEEVPEEEFEEEEEEQLEEDSEVEPGDETEDSEEKLEEDSELENGKETEEEQGSEEGQEEEIVEEQLEEDSEEEMEEAQGSEKDRREIKIERHSLSDEIEEEQEGSEGEIEEEEEEEEEEDLEEEDPDEVSSSKTPEDDPDEDPSEEEEGVQEKSRFHTNRENHNRSNDEKISRMTPALSSPLQVHESQKKCRFEEAFKPEFAFNSVDSNKESALGKGESVAKSGKRRFSRWEPQLGQDGDIDTQATNGKIRKTRWDVDDSKSTMLSHPPQMPIRKEVVHLEIDPVVQQLKAELIEINHKLQASELHDERPEHERSPSPEPIYNNLGLRINTREVRLREKLTKVRKRILTKLIKKNAAFQPPPPLKKPEKTFEYMSKRIYIPVKEFPTYNFIGLILGPRGNTQKRMEKETGAKIHLRGKGAERTSQNGEESVEEEDLHVLIEAGSRKSLDSAVEMVEKLLVPRQDKLNEHKRAQLKELAKLRGNYRNENICEVCKEVGHRFYVCPQRPSTLEDIPEKEIDDRNLYVGHLPKSVDGSRLREMFSPFGKITSSTVIKDRNTGVSKGYGFVKYENSTDAASASMHMSKYQIDGHMLIVRVAGTNPKPQVPTGVPALAPLPLYPGLYPSISNHVGSPSQPVSMLPGGQISFLDGNQLPRLGSTIATPAFFSGLKESKAAQSFPGSLAQFPGDPDYPGMAFGSYFT